MRLLMPRFEVYLRAHSDSGALRSRNAVGDMLVAVLGLCLVAHVVDRLSIERVVAPVPLPESRASLEMQCEQSPMVCDGCVYNRCPLRLYLEFDESEIPPEDPPMYAAP